jgi:hypothetical protein
MNCKLEKGKIIPSLDIQVYELGLAWIWIHYRNRFDPSPARTYCNWASVTALIPVRYVLELGLQWPTGITHWSKPCPSWMNPLPPYQTVCQREVHSGTGPRKVDPLPRDCKVRPGNYWNRAWHVTWWRREQMEFAILVWFSWNGYDIFLIFNF